MSSPISPTTIREALKFVAGAVIVYLLANLLVFSFLKIPAFDAKGAYALTQLLMIAINFALNRWWVFKSNSSQKMKQLVQFIALNVTFRFIDWLIFVTIFYFFTPPIPLTIFVAMLLVFPVKFVVYRTHVFTKTP